MKEDNTKIDQNEASLAADIIVTLIEEIIEVGSITKPGSIVIMQKIRNYLQNLQ